MFYFLITSVGPVRLGIHISFVNFFLFRVGDFEEGVFDTSGQHVTRNGQAFRVPTSMPRGRSIFDFPEIETQT